MQSLLREHRNWAVQTNHLLRHLSQVLSTTVQAWEDFFCGDVQYFLDTNQKSMAFLLTAHENFDKLRMLSQQLKHLSIRCNEFSRNVSSITSV